MRQLRIYLCIRAELGHFAMGRVRRVGHWTVGQLRILELSHRAVHSDLFGLRSVGMV